MACLAALLWFSTRTGRQSERSSELVLYCAAGFIQPVTEVCNDYEKEYGVKVQIDPAASGTLLSKLRVAPDKADLFLSGEESFMRDARRQDLVAEVLPLAWQRVVLAVAPGNPRKIAGLADLRREDIRLVLPNPELTAVGRATQRALRGKPGADILEKRRKSQAPLSYTGNVNEAANAVKIGAADATLVWDSIASQFALDVVDVPEFKQGPAELAAVGVAAQSRNPTGALHFARYLTARDRGEIAMARHHFGPLEDADVWQDRPELLLMSGAMLKPGIEGLVKSFSQREGVTINTVYQGCGILVAEMKAIKGRQSAAAAHFPDAYFSCDVSFMRQVQPWFEASTIITRNDMVLVVPKGNPKQVKSIADLARPDLRVGLAHPVNSALGALTDALLKKLRLHAKVYDPGRKHPIVHADAGHDLVNKLRVGAST